MHNGTTPEQTPSDRPLIMFAFFETETSKPNFEYFLKHALHDAADFLFVINGDTELYKIIPDRPNVRYVRRKNDCYDMGAFAEILLKDDLWRKYQRYITLNASIRGPFFPSFSNACWSDEYLNKVTDKVKVYFPATSKRVSSNIEITACRNDSRLSTQRARSEHDMGYRSRRDGDPPLPLRRTHHEIQG